MADTQDVSEQNVSESGSGLAQPALRRAEALLDGFGQRVREARTKVEVKAEAEGKQAAKVASQESSLRPATERAGESLDRAGERLGRFVSAAALYARRSAAFAREEAEDILAEAQTLRHGSLP